MTFRFPFTMCNQTFSIVLACISARYTCHLYVMHVFDIICTFFYLENTVLYTLCTTQKYNSVYPLYILKIRCRISPVYLENTILYIFCICRKNDFVYHLYMWKKRFRISSIYVEYTVPYILCIRRKS
jgi:hypothetical protein